MKTAWRMGIAAFALAFSLGTARAADYTMRISHQLPPTHPVAKALDQFAADVKASTRARVDVQIFGSEQLFKAAQNHAAVAKGQVEAASIVSVTWGNTIPELNVLTIPFLMTRVEQWKKFPTSQPAKLIEAKIEAKGVKTIAWMVDATDSIFTSSKAPLTTPAAFKGLKIRGLSKIFDAGLVALGASPSSMPGSEVYQALQTGVLDAGLTSMDAAYSRRFYEVQKYGSAMVFQTVYQLLIVNPAWWDKLPGDLKAAIEKAAHGAEEFRMPKNATVDEDAVARLKAKGMDVAVPTPAQLKPLADIMQPPVIKAYIESCPEGATLVEMIKGL